MGWTRFLSKSGGKKYFLSLSKTVMLQGIDMKLLTEKVSIRYCQKVYQRCKGLGVGGNKSFVAH